MRHGQGGVVGCGGGGVCCFEIWHGKYLIWLNASTSTQWCVRVCFVCVSSKAAQRGRFSCIILARHDSCDNNQTINPSFRYVQCLKSDKLRHRRRWWWTWCLIDRLRTRLPTRILAISHHIPGVLTTPFFRNLSWHGFCTLSKSGYLVIRWKGFNKNVDTSNTLAWPSARRWFWRDN